eukprot:6173670-Pleurochrysis_carterae.AAC.1
MLQGCASLCSLDLSGCSRLTETSLIEIAHGCPKLQSLDVGSCKSLVTDKALVVLAAKCSSLRSLNLRFCEQVPAPWAKRSWGLLTFSRAFPVCAHTVAFGCSVSLNV